MHQGPKCKANDKMLSIIKWQPTPSVLFGHAEFNVLGIFYGGATAFHAVSPTHGIAVMVLFPLTVGVIARGAQVECTLYVYLTLGGLDYVLRSITH